MGKEKITLNKQQFEKLFPLGSHLCREPMPSMSELKADMENLKRHGFNLVKLQEHWMVDEPLEGVYDFSKYHELIEHAAKLDMGVYIGLTCEQAPGWLYRKYPDCRMVGKDGIPVAYEAQTTLPADGKPGPCYDHPGAMGDQLRFIKRLVTELGQHENIVVWNIWQEIGYWSEYLVGAEVCYCPYTLHHFRQWLKQKYGDLDGLNKAWNTNYQDWEYVLPSRERESYCLPQNVDWNYFMKNVQVVNVLKERARVIHETDPLNRPVFAHVGAPIIGSGVDWNYARSLDFLGSSMYPAWGAFHNWDDGAPARREKPNKQETILAEMCDIALKFDYIRSCNRKGAPIWAAEFQGGRTSNGFFIGRVPQPEDIRRWMLTAVASGVTGISFWVTRAEIAAAEADGFSLLDSIGETTTRYEEASRIGKALNKYPELFGKPSSPVAKMAIMVNEYNYQLLQTIKEASEHISYTTRGWHRLLWELGIPVDFVDISQLKDESISNYNVLLVPFPFSMSEEVAKDLAAYVRKGGNLISEACPGRITANVYACRGELSPTMASVCGVRHKGLTLISEPGDKDRWSPPALGWGQYAEPAMLIGEGEFAGKSLRANVYLETYECESAKPILSIGQEAAGVVNTYGEGKAYLIGTIVGHNGTAYRDSETRDFIQTLLEKCGVKNERQDKLLLRKRVAGNREALIFINPTDGPIIAEIDVSKFNKVEDLLGDELPNWEHSVKITVPAMDIRVLVCNR